MDKHEKYNKSEKGKERWRRYARKHQAEQTYYVFKLRLKKRILEKQIKITELERILNNAEKI